MMTETSDHPPFDWQLVARRLLGDDVTVRDAGDRTVTTPGGEVAHIRAWSPPATVERVTATRALLSRVPEATRIPRPVGDPGDVAMLAGRVADACTVLAGLPLNRHGRFDVPGRGEIGIPLHESTDPGDMLVEAARVLARVHSATRDQPELAATGQLSALELHVAAKARWQEARKVLGSHAASLPEVRRWLRCGNRVIPIAGERLEAAGEVAAGHPVLIHNDIWPAWLLVDAPSRPQELRGVTGWTSAVAGSPVIDLAQLSVRVSGWSAGTAESVLGAYSELAELQPAERRLVPVVAAVDLLDRLAWLLEIAYLDDAIANDPAQPFIRGGIKVLLRSLEQLTDVLAPPEPVHRRPGGPGRWVRSTDRRPTSPRPSRSGARRPPRQGRRRRAGG
jgi:Ser/Thr protein kinase RdoA (MazF antagonist)